MFIFICRKSTKKYNEVKEEWLNERLFWLSNKNVVVTGASSGMGKATGRNVSRFRWRKYMHLIGMNVM